MTERHQSHVRDWMSHDLVTVRPDTSLIEAYERMRARRVRRLPALDGRGALVGIVTRSDIEQVMPPMHDPQQRGEAAFAVAGRTVAEVMASRPITVAPTDSVGRAAARMLAARVSGLPVVEGGRLVGVITESDIFRLVAAAWAEG